MNNYKIELTTKFLVRYSLCLLGWLIAEGIATGLCVFLVSRKTWYTTDFLGPILHWMHSNITALFMLVAFVGWFIISVVFIMRSMHYLKLVVDAAGKLTQSDVNFIRLPAFLKDIQDELNMLKEKERRNLEIAKEAEQRKNDLIVYLAHDLKTPLTSVIGYLSILDEQPDLAEEQRKRYTEIVLNKSMRLENLINEFFDITRFNLSQISLDLENINLSRMMEQIVSEFTPVLEEKELNWDLQIDKDVSFLCDPDKLERVFDNLIRNAVLYSYPRSSIFFSLKNDADHINITIRNHGKTLGQDKLEHIFEQFFRVDKSRGTSTGGSGLGLAIAKEIVELHGGTISARSENETITFICQIKKS